MVAEPIQWPVVIKMYSYPGASKSVQTYFARILWYWLEEYAIPGIAGTKGFPDGTLLSRNDTIILKTFVQDHSENLVFLKPGVKANEVARVIEILEKASNLCIKGRKNDQHQMKVLG